MLQCPKCGTENPNNAQTCSWCSYALTAAPTTEPKPKTKPSGKAIFLHAFGIGILYFILLLLSAVSTVVLLFTVLFLTIRSISNIITIKKTDAPFKAKYFGIISNIPNFILVCVLLLSIDASPIQDDYTIADLRSAPPDCARSYELLMSLSEKEGDTPDRPEIGLSAQDINTIYQVNDAIREGNYSSIREALKANAQAIHLTWENAKKGRDVINELNTFPEIADLTEPDFMANIGFLANLRMLGLLHQAYAFLQYEQGNARIAVDELIKFDLAIRKLSENARPTVTKLVCYALLGMDISTANFIANNPQTSLESLEFLAEHFKLITDEHVSLRNPIIFEYLTSKSMLNSLPFIGTRPAVRNLPFFKRNSTLRMCRNWFNHLIDIPEGTEGTKSEQLSVWPWIYPDLGPAQLDSDGQLPWYYKRYNPLGSMILGIMMPALERVFHVKTKLEIHSDLLQIVLNKRLGKEVSLKARAYGNEYIIDVEEKNIFSPGPDGEPHTDDDVKLPVNSEVLGLSSQ